ncbi:MAG: hypothetical protein WBQ10_01455, partial [Terriglobales bacterium]
GAFLQPASSLTLPETCTGMRRTAALGWASSTGSRPRDNGTWKETTLLTFNDGNGSQPVGDLLLDAAENLYGSAYLAGKYRGGGVFELSPK